MLKCHSQLHYHFVAVVTLTGTSPDTSSAHINQRDVFFPLGACRNNTVIVSDRVSDLQRSL